ncbi:MAG TPA: metal ABC transporter permease [Myxococcales bacterium]|nr:metal ABC transporter permease [Myxococcales bacterium]
MALELQILLPAFLACLVLTGIHAYLGLHVLAREVIFIDIALAQIAALGAAVAALYGLETHSRGSYAWSLGFTLVGAVIFAATRGVRHRVPVEAVIGITYAVAAAAAVVVANFLSHGDEEIKELLIGNLLAVRFQDVAWTAGIYSLLGLFHWIFRRQFISLSFDGHVATAPAGPGIGGPSHRRDMFWDLLFYASFGAVITSSVHMAGVLLVFSFLIVPAVFSALFTSRLRMRLLIAWTLGATVSIAGLWGSFKFDLPTGAAVVVTFGVALILGAIVRALIAPKAPPPGAV